MHTILILQEFGLWTISYNATTEKIWTQQQQQKQSLIPLGEVGYMDHTTSFGMVKKKIWTKLKKIITGFSSQKWCYFPPSTYKYQLQFKPKSLNMFKHYTIYKIMHVQTLYNIQDHALYSTNQKSLKTKFQTNINFIK